MWRGYRVNYAVAGQGLPIVIVHGFGSNVHHFRKLTADLCEQYTGASASLWSAMGLVIMIQPDRPFSGQYIRSSLHLYYVVEAAHEQRQTGLMGLPYLLYLASITTNGPEYGPLRCCAASQCLSNPAVASYCSPRTSMSDISRVLITCVCILLMGLPSSLLCEALSFHIRWPCSCAVYAMDLLGFGSTEKPAGIAYDPHLWKDQVVDFVNTLVPEPCVLLGNSIGSQVGTTHLMGRCHDVLTNPKTNQYS